MAQWQHFIYVLLLGLVCDFLGSEVVYSLPE